MTDLDPPKPPYVHTIPSEDLEPAYHLRMASLAWSFPSLFDADGLYPWDPLRLDRWLTSGSRPREAVCAGRFVLSVWNAYYHWSAGSFEVHDALGCWDSEHIKAFARWVEHPWWP